MFADSAWVVTPSNPARRPVHRVQVLAGSQTKGFPSDAHGWRILGVGLSSVNLKNDFFYTV